MIRSSSGDREVLVAPSLMCADFLRLAESVQEIEEAGVDLIHFDIMDAHFVPNLPMGLGILSALRGTTRLPFDVHLMVERNDWFVEEVARIGAERIAIHVESSPHLDRSLALIRSHGALAGAALNPATPLSMLDWVVDRLDFVLLMTVNPGFAGQKLVPATIEKIRACRRWLDERGSRAAIEVDGNVSFEHIPRMVEAGADILVAGTSSIYAKGRTIRENMAELVRTTERGFAGDIA